MRVKWAVALMLMVLGAACEREDILVAEAPAEVVGPLQFASPDAARIHLEGRDEFEVEGCNAFDVVLGTGDDGEGEVGQLNCGVVVEGQLYEVIISIYDDEFYPEREYRDACFDTRLWRQWWLMWRDGQNWWGEISTYKSKERPSEEVASTIADALGSAAWKGCTGADS